MKKIIITERSAHLLKLKNGSIVRAGGVDCIVRTIPNFDPYNDHKLSNKEVDEIIKHKTMELAFNPNIFDKSAIRE